MSVKSTCDLPYSIGLFSTRTESSGVKDGPTEVRLVFGFRNPAFKGLCQ
jgi:hypothetical protein